MNCQESRRHLYPYLDDELEITQNLAILEHLNCCPPCLEIFTAEENSWTAVRDHLQQESVPEDFERRMEAALWSADRRTRYRRVASFLTGVAATLLAVILISNLAGTGHTSSDPTDSPYMAPMGHDHGPGISAAIGNFLQVMNRARDSHTDVMDTRFLQDQHYRIVPDMRQSLALADLCGRTQPIPEQALSTTTRVALRNLNLLGQEVTHGLFDLDGQEIGIFRLSREAARVAGLSALDVDGSQKIQLAECKDCRVVAVSKQKTVWILVSRPSSDAALKFARKVF